MNVSDLLQDSPSQHRRRPPALQHESPLTQSATPSLPSASVSPQSQHQPQHPHAHSHPSQPPPVPQTSYPPQPNPYYPSHPSFPPDPPPMHHLTPRPPAQIQPTSIDPTPAMASLQHPSPSAPPPHVHPHTSWGPHPAPRQGSSPLAMSNLGPGHHPRTSHQQPPAQIKSAMPGSERSPVVQRGHASGSSTPSNIAAHSPPSKPLLTTAAGILILDKRTADEQMARPAVQAQTQSHGPPSAHLGTNPGATFKPGREREKEWERERERQQEDMDFIRHAARERVGPFDRERERERALPSPRERSLASPHERSLTSSHDRPIPPAHDRPVLSPHERDRPPHHMHRMSPLTRATQAQPPPSLRTPAQVQQSPPGPSHRMSLGPPPHDRMPPPNERDRMPPPPRERPPHDRDRIHAPPPFSHSHRQGPPLLPGQGQFQAHPPEWDPGREREVVVARERERELARERDMSMGGPPRDLVREKDLDPTRDSECGYHPDHDQGVCIRERERQRLREGPRDQAKPLPQRERDVIPPGPRDITVQKEREREMLSVRDRERMMERERELRSREMEGIPIPPRERDMREREVHIPRERERVAGLYRDGETGPGMLPRGHDRERERDRERRTNSRMPSPHGMNIGGAGVPPLASTSTTGPGAPGLHHPPPPHDYSRERELQLMNERERQLAWERDREREREMDRRQYRERIPIPDRERMGMPVLERDNERIAPTDRERAMVERDRAMFERERVAFSDRDRTFTERDRLERERMVERDRVFLERERIVINDRDRVMHERERPLPPEQHAVLERERAFLERSGDRERMPMRSHPFDMAERERVEAFERERERERLEATGGDRERGIATATASGVEPSRDREGDKDRKVVDVSMIERERYERPTGPVIDREVDEKRERERLEHMERERGAGIDREREPMNAPDREGEHTEAERGRLETRERLEMVQRELGKLFERDRLGGLDAMERDHLGRLERENFELVERERLEMLERERLEILERMPSAEELAKARKEREKKPFVSLGTYVWPRTPFPYYFPEWIPTPVVDEVEVKISEAGPSSSSSIPSSAPQPTPAATQIPTELRLTVLVPPSFLPPARPQKFRLWGGGLPPPPPFPFTPSIYSFSRRRVYTDDSDVIQCAVHAGLLTWSGIARAKKEDRTIRVVLALVPTLASASGAVKSGQSDSRIGVNGLGANGHVNGSASAPRTRTNTPLPPPISSAPSTSSSNNDPQPPGYAGGVWASRFIGGWGESFYGEENAGRGGNAGRMTNFEEAEDDGRGCVSCGWGWGHDGSAYEVISVDVVEQNAHVAPGLGIRNRAQRLAEYTQRRADVLGLPLPPSPPLLDVTNAPKRRRLDVELTEMKKAGLSEVTAIADEARKMQAMTISFGVPDRSKSKTGIGFKYDAQVVQCALFPHLHQGPIANPPPKRRKIAVARENHADVDVDMDSADDPGRGIVLESATETYLITRGMHGGKARYTLSALGPSERPAETPFPNASQPCASTSTISPTDADLETQVAQPSLPEAMSTDDPPSLSGGTTDPPESGTTQDSASKGRETDASSKPPSTPCLPASPKPIVRVLRSNLSDEDFTFENDIIIIKGAQHHTNVEEKVVDGDGNGEGDALKIRALRWRWNLKSRRY